MANTAPRTLLVLTLLFLLSACAAAKVAVVDKTAVGNKNDVRIIVTSDDVEDPLDVGDCIVESFLEHGIVAEATSPESAWDQSGSGSGFVVADGYWATNNHVANGMENITVSVPGRDIPLTLVAKNAEVDLAILKGDTSGLKPIKIGTPEVGEEVVVAGYPITHILSDSIRITTGVVSSLDGWEKNHTRVQFTAPIQGGNSGGPMVGDNWELAGVVVATLATEATMSRIGAVPQGLNLAVSPNDLKGFLLQNGITQQGPYVENLQELMASTGLVWNGEINKNKRAYVLQFTGATNWDVMLYQLVYLRVTIIDLSTGGVVAKGSIQGDGLGLCHPTQRLIEALLKELQWL